MIINNYLLNISEFRWLDMPFVNITLSASNKAPESMKTKTG